MNAGGTGVFGELLADRLGRRASELLPLLSSIASSRACAAAIVSVCLV
jgi:hypothetical protein